jgi:hypothetical protein
VGHAAVGEGATGRCSEGEGCRVHTALTIWQNACRGMEHSPRRSLYTARSYRVSAAVLREQTSAAGLGAEFGLRLTGTACMCAGCESYVPQWHVRAGAGEGERTNGTALRRGRACLEMYRVRRLAGVAGSQGRRGVVAGACVRGRCVSEYVKEPRARPGGPREGTKRGTRDGRAGRGCAAELAVGRWRVCGLRVGSAVFRG